MGDDANIREQLERELSALRQRVAELEAQELEWRRAATSLRESEALYRSLVETSPDAITLTDLEGRIVAANRQTALLHGFASPEELLASDHYAFDLIAPQDVQRARENAKKTLQIGSVSNVQYHLLRNDGTLFPAELSARLIVDAEGSPKGFMGVVRDITERIQAQKELDRRLRETVLLNRVISAAASALEPNAVMEILCTELAHALDVPQAAFAQLDSERQCLKVTAEYLPKDRPSALGVEIPVEGNLATQYVLEHRVPLAVPDAQTDPRQAVIHDIEKRRGTVSLLIVPVLVRDEVMGTIGLDETRTREFTSDEIELVQTVAAAVSPALENARLYEALGIELAERKRAQETLRQYTRELEARNEDLDAFAHTVAHDLRNPLALVTGLGETLEDLYGSLTGDEMRHYLRMIARNGHKMNSIIKELLLLANVRMKEEVESEPLDTTTIIDEVQESLAYLIEDHSAEIILPQAWPAALGYAPWVEEVWVNYVSNAITYGGRPPKVELGATIQADGMIRCWVRDNGPGIAPDMHHRLFMPFERFHQARAKGHGLGLSIVRRIVEKLGGQVGFESEGIAGHGSLFFFTLPSAE